MQPKYRLIILALFAAMAALPVMVHGADTKTSPDTESSQALAIGLSDQPATIELSTNNINRIHCSEPIKKINAPESMGLEVEYQGNDAFIKLGKNAKPGVIYIINQSGEVFSIEINPKRGVKARVINLESKSKKERENRLRFAKLDQETAAVDLIRNAFADTIPDTFSVDDQDREIKAIKNLKIFHRRKVTADGLALALNEYLVSLTPFSSVTGMKVDESSFLVPRLTHHPTAIALGKDLAGFVNGKAVLKKGQYLRLFIVEKKKE